MTKKMPAIFAQHPPKKPFKTLDDIVDYWIAIFGKGGPQAHRRDTVVEYCAASTTLVQAIHRACDSRAANNKMHNHQSRVRAKDRAQFAKNIIDTINRPKNFDELHDTLVKAAPKGIGPVTIYDVATRIGAYMKKNPTSLYLHAGVRVGWTLLHGKRSPNVERIAKKDLPKPLQRLPPDEVEDMLCAFRDYLNPGLMK